MMLDKSFGQRYTLGVSFRTQRLLSGEKSVRRQISRYARNDNDRKMLCFLFGLVISLHTVSLAQDHARGVSKPGPLGNTTAIVYLPVGAPISNIEIVKVTGKQAFVNAGQSHTLEIGQKFRVARKVKDRWMEVGEVRVIAVLKAESVVELVISKPEKKTELRVGDRFVKN